MKCFTFLFAALAFACAAPAADLCTATWWWDARHLARPEETAARLDFLARENVTEIYCCFPLDEKPETIAGFVRAAAARGMATSWLAGDVSWIHPGALGFFTAYEAFRRYQRTASPETRLKAFHLDVEPHQDNRLSDARRWQLYADFVLQAAALVHRDGERIEWDIPFWLETKRVNFGTHMDVPLVDVVMGCSDGVTLMSYRDTAAAMLDVSRPELACAARFPRCRVILGAETGASGEGDFITFFEEGRSVLNRELDSVRQALATKNVPAGTGVAVHHVGSWMKLKK